MCDQLQQTELLMVNAWRNLQCVGVCVYVGVCVCLCNCAESCVCVCVCVCVYTLAYISLLIPSLALWVYVLRCVCVYMLLCASYVYVSMYFLSCLSPSCRG